MCMRLLLKPFTTKKQKGHRQEEKGHRQEKKYLNKDV